MATRKSSLSRARAAKTKLASLLDKHPLVNGIGITKIGDGYGIKLNLSASKAKPRIPEQIDGVPIRVEVVGPIVKRTGLTA